MEKGQVKKEIFSWIKTILAAVVMVLIVNLFFVVNAQIPSGSMENTLMIHDRLLVNRLAYLKEGPQRGDIVVFHSDEGSSGLLIKRVIGLPGETVEGMDGIVYIDGVALEEDYCKPDQVLEPFAADFGPFEVPEDCYFMMGDNREGSLDARFWENKFVSRKKILGKAYFRYFPHVSGLE